MSWLASLSSSSVSPLVLCDIWRYSRIISTICGRVTMKYLQVSIEAVKLTDQSFTVAYGGPLGPFPLRISLIEILLCRSHISPVQISHFSCANLYISPVQISHFSSAKSRLPHPAAARLSNAHAHELHYFHLIFIVTFPPGVIRMNLELHFEPVAGVTCLQISSSCMQ